MATLQFDIDNGSAWSNIFPETVLLADGGFAVAWSADLHTSNYRLNFQVFDRDGFEVGVERSLSGATVDHESIAATADGGFVVTHLHQASGDIRFARYNRDGQLIINGEVAPDPPADDRFVMPVTVFGTPDGGFGVVYDVIDTDGFIATTFIRHFDLLGRPDPGGRSLFAIQDPQDLDILQLSAGGYAAVWADFVGGLYYAPFDGETIGRATELFPGAPRLGPEVEIVELANGDIAVFGEQANPNLSRERPLGVILKPDGTHVADVELPGLAAYRWGADYSVAALASGGFVIVRDFGERNEDEGPLSVFAYDDLGRLIGGPDAVPQPIATDPMVTGHAVPSALGLADGGYFVAWTTSPGGTWGLTPGTSSSHIVGRIVGQPTGRDDYFALDAPGAVSGGFGDDVLIGSEKTDELRGDAGRDVLSGNGGADDLEGGPGSDFVQGGAGEDEIGGGGGDDVLDGGLDADVIAGDNGDDSIYGGHGADQILGGSGYDSMFGGLGDDVLIGGDQDPMQSFFDAITELVDRSFENSDDPNASTYQLIFAQIFQTLQSGLATDLDGNRLDGGAGDDVLIGGGGEDSIDGQFGDDMIFGRNGADFVYGGLGLDTLHGEGGADRLKGGRDEDDIFGGGAGDFLSGGEGDDWIEGGPGDDALIGGAGVDRLDGGDGLDLLSGGDGADTAFGGEGGDVLAGGFGDDWLYAGGGSDLALGGAEHDRIWAAGGEDQVRGGGGDDFLFGGNGDDVLRGDAGRDQLRGEAGRDRLVGGTANDEIAGGAGADIIVWRDGDGRDVVNDFTPDVDRLHLGAATGIERFGDVIARSSDVLVGGQPAVRIQFDDGGRVHLVGVAVSSLDAGDFIF